jgi:hypothetical protein
MITVDESKAFKGRLDALIVNILLEMILLRNWGPNVNAAAGRPM